MNIHHGLNFIELTCRRELCFGQSVLLNFEIRKYTLASCMHALLLFVSLVKNSDEMRSCLRHASDLNF